MYVYMSNVTFAIDNTTGIYNYEDIENGDIIEFDTKIKGTIRLHSYINNSYYTPSSSVSGWLDVHYCTDNKCLENGDYDVTKPLVTGTYSQTVDYSVLSYEDVFAEKNDKVVAWKAFLVKNELITSEKITSGTYGYSSYTEQQNLGTYFDIVLIPSYTEQKSCDNDNNIRTYIYSSQKLEEADVVTNFYKSKNVYSNTSNSSSGKLEYNFEASKGDAIKFRMKTDRTKISFYLNGKKVDAYLNADDYSDDYVTFNTYYIEVTESGKNKLEIILNSGETYYFSYIYIKDVEIGSFITEGEDLGDYKFSEDETIIKYTNCGNGVEFMEKMEIKEELTTTTTTTPITTTKKIEEKVENPKTGLKDFLPFFIAAALVAGLFTLNYNKIKLFKKI